MSQHQPLAELTLASLATLRSSLGVRAEQHARPPRASGLVAPDLVRVVRDLTGEVTCTPKGRTFTPKSRRFFDVFSLLCKNLTLS
jgi:hypothetical protein